MFGIRRNLGESVQAYARRTPKTDKVQTNENHCLMFQKRTQYQIHAKEDGYRESLQEEREGSTDRKPWLKDEKK